MADYCEVDVNSSEVSDTYSEKLLVSRIISLRLLIMPCSALANVPISFFLSKKSLGTSSVISSSAILSECCMVLIIGFVIV